MLARGGTPLGTSRSAACHPIHAPCCGSAAVVMPRHAKRQAPSVSAKKRYQDYGSADSLDLDSLASLDSLDGALDKYQDLIKGAAGAGAGAAAAGVGTGDDGELVGTSPAASVLSVGDGGHGCWCGTEGSATTGHSQHDPLVITMLQQQQQQQQRPASGAHGVGVFGAGSEVGVVRGAGAVSAQAVRLERQPEREGDGGLGMVSGTWSTAGSGRGLDAEGRLITPKADRGRAARGVVQRRVLRVLT